MGIRGDEGDGCRVVDGSVIPTIPLHLPISFSYIYISARKASARAMKSCHENKLLADSSTKGLVRGINRGLLNDVGLKTRAGMGIDRTRIRETAMATINPIFTWSSSPGMRLRKRMVVMGSMGGSIDRHIWIVK